MEGLKAGWKTTEFWLAIATIISSGWFTLKGFIPADLMVKIMALVSLVYAIGRSIVKFTPKTDDDKFLAELEEKFKK